MNVSRNYEEKKALVQKWFSKEELESIEGLRDKPISTKTADAHSSDLYSSVVYALPEIADEKERIMETVEAMLDELDGTEVICPLLTCLTSAIEMAVCEGDIVPDNVELNNTQIRDLLSVSYNIPALIKKILDLNRSAERIKFFERKIRLAQNGVLD